MAGDHWTPRELSAEENYALNYAMALIGGEKSIAWKRFAIANAKVTLSAEDKRKALQRGLNGLMAKGILECERDGHQEWVPRILHLEKMSPDTLIQS